MGDLTNFELCKRIAEIEGVKAKHGFNNLDGSVAYIAEDDCIPYVTAHYNPLTNKALLFDLMVKHKVDVQHGKSLSSAKIYDDPEDNPISEVLFYHEDTGYALPILMCIVEANNE